jgi:hypothetical protein
LISKEQDTSLRDSKSLFSAKTTMSSGTLPLAAYHRAQSLGEGTFGSVVAVFNDDGEEYALKLFLEDEDEEE